MFKLHPTLAADTLEVCELTLCKVLLMNNAHVPWVILVPQREGIRELYELNKLDQRQANTESALVSEAMMTLFKGDKLNTGAIGNIVPQLHLHHVVRYTNDLCWPKPVWGNLPEQAYTIDQQQIIRQNLNDTLQHQVDKLEPD